MSLIEEIQKNFSYLFEELGFVFLNEPESCMFIVIAQSGDIRLRFCKDRADFFLDVGKSSAHDLWIGLYDILCNIKQSGSISLRYKYMYKIKQSSSVLRKNFPVVKEYVLARLQRCCKSTVPHNRLNLR